MRPPGSPRVPGPRGGPVSGPSFSGGGPLGDLLRDLARLLTAQGPVNWEVARQLAVWTATGGESEANPEPLARMKTEELLRVAEMYVAQGTGLPTSRRGWLGLRCVTRAEWAGAMLSLLHDPLAELATSVQATMGTGAPEEHPAVPGPMGDLLGNLPQVLGPLMLGVQAGTMVGNLASRALGQYDVPLPGPPDDELLAVPGTVGSFAAEWDLPVDDVRMYVCLRDATYHTVLSRPHVSQLFRQHLRAYARAFDMDLGSLEGRLAAIDPMDPMAFQQSLGDPDALLGELRSDEQRRLMVPFRAFLAALVGYADHMVDTVGRRLVGSYSLVSEAVRRRRLEDGPGQRALGKLLGVEVDQQVVDAGHGFVAGVLERAGTEGLSRLWESEATLPTPAEVDAPGLWLARIDLPA